MGKKRREKDRGSPGDDGSQGGNDPLCLIHIVRGEPEYGGD